MYKNEKKKPIDEVVEYIPNLVHSYIKTIVFGTQFRIKHIYIACEN